VTILWKKDEKNFLKIFQCCGSGPRPLDPDPDFLPIPDPGVKNAPDPGSLIRNTVSDNFLEKKLKKIFIFS
jgi:hypothetical protein